MTKTPKPTKTTIVPLVHGRYRQLLWGLFLVPVALLLILKFGIGGALIGAFCAYSAVVNLTKSFKSFLHPAGTFTINDDSISFPKALCSGEERKVASSALRHAYILRHHTPWNRAAPLMILECDDGVYSYPRDWFASDNDQKRIVNSINRRRANKEKSSED